MIVVTAPTGRIGRHVVDSLLAAGEELRIVSRRPLPAEIGERAEVIIGSHADPAVLAEALPGADAVFWLVPAAPDAPSVDEAYSGFARAALDLFEDAQGGRVVGISALGRGTSVSERAGFVSATLRMDDRIAATGIPYRALTMPSFIDNLAWQVGPISSQGVFFGPYVPDLAMPAVGAWDIADVAVRYLRDGSWTGYEEVPVLGPEDLTYDEMASIMSDVLSRPVRYQQIEPEVFKANMIRGGYSDAMAQGLLDMGLAKNEGLDLGVTRTPANRTPRTFRQWCVDVLKPAIDA